MQLLTTNNLAGGTNFTTDSVVQEAVELLTGAASAADQQGWSGLALTLTELATVLDAIPNGSAQYVAAALLGHRPTTSTEEGNSGSIKN